MPRAKPRPAKRKPTTARPATPQRKAPRKAPRKAAPKAPFALPPGWALDEGGKSISLQRTTKDFLAAVVIINRVAALAEDLEHHPDIHLERWNHLRITTYSHDVGKLTERDERLAQGITGLLDQER